MRKRTVQHQQDHVKNWDGIPNLTQYRKGNRKERAKDNRLTSHKKSSIIRHHSFKECDWLRFFRSKLVKSNIVFLLIINMAQCHYCLHQTPIPLRLIQILLMRWIKTRLRFIHVQMLIINRKSTLTNKNVRHIDCSYLSPVFLKRFMSHP